MFGPIVADDERQSMHRFTVNIPRLVRNLIAFCQPGEP